MKKSVIITAIIFLLFSCFVNAQIHKDTTTIRCGDGVLDEFEMCEKDIETDRCAIMGDLLGIDSGCREEVCVCLPFVNNAFCGNDRREGVEMCDGIGKDFCPEFGNLTGLDLICGENCYCEVVGGVPASYYPGYNASKEEPAEGMAVCGDKKLQLKEECDPPNTLCTLDDGSVGICAKGCKCVAKESIGIPSKETEDKEETEKESDEEEIEESEEDDKEEKEELEGKSEERPGFFARLWQWIKDLFS